MRKRLHLGPVRGLLVLAAVCAGAGLGTAAYELRPQHHAGGSATAFDPPAAPRPLQPAPRRLPAPALYVSPRGDDGAPCSAAKPCRSFDRAYHAASPGTVVQLASGRYGDQTVTADKAKPGRGCESRVDLSSCVTLRPAPGAHVEVGNFTLGAGYQQTGPAGLAIVAGDGRTLRTTSTNLVRAGEVALWGVSQGNLFVTGGHDLAIRGGDVGGEVTPDGTHPEIQRVYGTSPQIVTERITIEGVRFHDINTTSPTAHVDCLQVENGADIVIRGNRFERCGSTGLRLSDGVESGVAPPRHVLIEDNLFGRCAPTPVSDCYYAAQLGVGHHVTVRGNTAEQALQPSDDPAGSRAIRYERNMAPGLTCERGVVYVHNAWVSGRCSRSDHAVAPEKLASAVTRRARSVDGI
jgi:hypothetical protein